MPLFSRIRHSLFDKAIAFYSPHSRRFSSFILSPDSTSPLTSKQKSRAALSLLKFEANPERILDICRAAFLTPDFHLDRIAYAIAVSKLSEKKHFDGICRYLEELKSRPGLKTEHFACHAIVLYGQVNMLDHAIRTFKQIDELGGLSFCKITCLLTKNSG